MKINDILQETFAALWANKTRSGLTILGIVIGIASVISMLAIGNGAQSSIQSSIQSIGSNLVIVQPGAQRGQGMNVSTGRGSAKTLTADDAKAIATITAVKAVAADLSSRYQITVKGKNTNTQVVGTVPDYATVRNLSVDSGSFITTQNLNSNAKVAVLGPTVRDDLFGTSSSAIGQTIRIKQVEFKVIGITATKGGSGFGSSDDMIFVPLTTAQKFLSGDDYVSSISVAATDANSATLVQQQITQLLLERHHLTSATADFSTLNQADIAATASSVTQTFTILLGAIAGISLIVGGIGIMNMMLMTVTERTREIGLRKAIGAKRRDISIQFLVEAVALTLISGIIGVILGWIISLIITSTGLLQTKVTMGSVLLAFSVSALIGIAFGYYPARRASGLNPIDALRFE